MNAKEIIKKIEFHLDYYTERLKEANCKTLIEHYYTKVQDTLEIMSFTEIISEEKYQELKNEALTIASDLKERLWYEKHLWLTIEKKESNSR